MPANEPRPDHHILFYEEYKVGSGLIPLLKGIENIPATRWSFYVRIGEKDIRCGEICIPYVGYFVYSLSVFCVI